MYKENSFFVKSRLTLILRPGITQIVIKQKHRRWSKQCIILFSQFVYVIDLICKLNLKNCFHYEYIVRIFSFFYADSGSRIFDYCWISVWIFDAKNGVLISRLFSATSVSDQLFQESRNKCQQGVIRLEVALRLFLKK